MGDLCRNKLCRHYTSLMGNNCSLHVNPETHCPSFRGSMSVCVLKLTEQQLQFLYRRVKDAPVKASDEVDEIVSLKGEIRTNVRQLKLQKKRRGEYCDTKRQKAEI